MKWEYRRVSTSAMCHKVGLPTPVSGHAPIAVLDEMGEAGWELVESYETKEPGTWGGGDRDYMFKRQAPQ